MVKNGVKHLYNRFYPIFHENELKKTTKTPYFNLNDVFYPIILFSYYGSANVALSHFFQKVFRIFKNGQI
jgi:hypothetical protein